MTKLNYSKRWKVKTLHHLTRCASSYQVFTSPVHPSVLILTRYVGYVFVKPVFFYLLNRLACSMSATNIKDGGCEGANANNAKNM